MQSNSTSRVPYAPRVTSTRGSSPSIKPPIPVERRSSQSQVAVGPTREAAAALPPMRPQPPVKPPVPVREYAPRVEPTWLERLGQISRLGVDGTSAVGDFIEKARNVVMLGVMNKAFGVDVARNAYKGAVENSIVPDRFAPQPKIDMPGVQAAGGMAAIVGETAAIEIKMLQGLAFAARRGSPLAAKALAGGNNTLVGAAVTSLAADAASQAAQVATGDLSAEEGLGNVRPSAILGGTVAGLAYAPKVVGTAVSPMRRVFPKFDEMLNNIDAKVMEPLRDRFVYEHKLARYAGQATREDIRYTLADDFRTYQAMAGNTNERTRNRVYDHFAPAALRAETFDVDQLDEIEEFLPLLQAWSEYGMANRLGAVYGMVPDANGVEKWTKLRSFDEAKKDYEDMFAVAPSQHQDLMRNHVRLSAEVYENMARSGNAKSAFAFYTSGLNYALDAKEYTQNVYRHIARSEGQHANRWFWDAAASTNGVPLSTMAPNDVRLLQAGETVNGLKMVIPDDAGKGYIKRMLQVAHGDPLGPDQIALPVDIADKILSLGVAKPVPPWMKRIVNPLTNTFKAGTLFWSMGGYLAKNAIGDAPALVRSFGADLGNREAWANAIETQRTFYRISGDTFMKPFKHAASGAGLGAAIGTGEELLEDDEFSMGAVMTRVMAGAGLGALSGTIAMGRTMNSNREFDAPFDIYDIERYMARADRQLLADHGVVDSGFVGAEMSKQLERMGLASTREDSVVNMLMDETRALITGKAYPLSMHANKTIDGFWTAAAARENIMRSFAFYSELSKGTSELLAAKRAREAFVDYGKFTDFENTWLRGFALPFYSFARHSVPNWYKAALGADVGGGGTAAQLATGAILGMDVAAQAWNEEFFSEVEMSLSPEVRRNFHIVVGNPITGQPMRNEKGEPIVFGMEMPYEQAMELLGAPRPGEIYSAIFGNKISNSDSLLARWQRQEDFDLLSDAGKAIFDNAAGEIKSLLSPGIALPVEVSTGKHLAWGTPIFRPWEDAGLATQWAEHVSRRLLPSLNAVMGEHQDGESNPVSSGFGLGIPLTSMNQDQAMIYRFLDQMENAEDEQRAKVPLLEKVREVVRGGGVDPKAQREEIERIASEADDPETTEYLLRYAGAAIGRRTDLVKQWEVMDVKARAQFLKTLSAPEKVAFLVYMNGGTVFNETTRPPAGAGAPAQ